MSLSLPRVIKAYPIASNPRKMMEKASMIMRKKSGAKIPAIRLPDPIITRIRGMVSGR